MANIKNLINEILFEKHVRSIKVFYNIDVTLYPGEDVQASQEEQPIDQADQQGQQPTQQQPMEQPQTMVQPTQQQAPLFSKKLKEDIDQQADVSKPEKIRANGFIALDKDESTNIQTVEDMIEFLSGKIDSGKENKDKSDDKKIFNEFVKEALILITTGQPMNEIVGKKDKFIIEIDYGFDRDADSVGMKVNKLENVGSMSISMKKDNQIIPGPFNVVMFNDNLIRFRNELISPGLGSEEN